MDQTDKTTVTPAKAARVPVPVTEGRRSQRTRVIRAPYDPGDVRTPAKAVPVPAEVSPKNVPAPGRVLLETRKVQAVIEEAAVC